MNGWVKNIVVVLLMILMDVLNLSKSFWIGYGEKTNMQFSSFFAILVFLFVSHTAVDILKWLTLKKNINEKAGALGSLYIQSLFRAKITWFDSKPVG